MPPDGTVPPDIQGDLLQHTVDEKRVMYDDLADSAKVLDTRAQSVVTISGVFLAAMSIFLKDDVALTDLSRWLLIAALVLIVWAIITAIRIMWVREIIAPPSYDNENGVLIDLLKTNKQLDVDDRKMFMRTQLSYWRTCCTSFEGLVKTKSDLLRVAQCCIIGAGALVAFVTGMRILH